MHPSPGGDELRNIIARANQPNGAAPIANVKPRRSGWVCPKCGTHAEQRAEAIESKLTGAAPVIQWLQDPDGKPMPVNVSAQEITGENDDGSPALYVTRHCLNCFNAWQRRKMMEDIRANVPQLEYRGKDDAAQDT